VSKKLQSGLKGLVAIKPSVCASCFWEAQLFRGTSQGCQMEYLQIKIPILFFFVFFFWGGASGNENVGIILWSFGTFYGFVVYICYGRLVFPVIFVYFTTLVYRNEKNLATLNDLHRTELI
jgi:hypothetical protein